jgi:hypothetical protein
MPRNILAAVALAIASLQVHAASIVATPSIPAYGQPVSIDLGDTAPYFLPSVSYTRSGNSIVIDYEALANGFGPYPPNMGALPVELGELAPGNYKVTARIFDIDRPGVILAATTTNVPVVPPTQYGVYPVPRVPDAYGAFALTLRSAAYFDTSSMRVTVNGPTIRLDFTYDPSASTTPSGSMQMYGTVDVGRMAPGLYHVEAWGAPAGGVAQKFFTTDVAVARSSTVVEYYQPDLDHYFVSAGPGEIASTDAGRNGNWKRTGQSFKAWLDPADAPAQAQPVCRFYATGSSSHFYTADPAECDSLRSLEKSQRAQSQAAGTVFGGWSYEGIAFYALVPTNGECAAGTSPVWRAYNHREAENDPNHRFMPDPRVRYAMLGWTQEGVAFCSPS